MSTRLHSNEIQIDLSLVRRMVDTQFPQYAERTLSIFDSSGSTNILFLLGDDLLVRFPRQIGGGETITKEWRWLPVIARHVPLQVPEVVAFGEPVPEFCEHWSIMRLLEGELPEPYLPSNPPAVSRIALAHDLADVIIALRNIDVSAAAATDPTLRSYRGGSLRDFDEQTRRNINQCRSIENLDLDLDGMLSAWLKGLELPGASTPCSDRWYHGDLVAENLLMSDGRLCGVLDFGGLAIGDPTIDLHGAWELFDSPAREEFRIRLGVNEAEWLRGRAWGLAISISAISYYWNRMPMRCRSRLAMAWSVLEDVGKRG